MTPPNPRLRQILGSVAACLGFVGSLFGLLYMLNYDALFGSSPNKQLKEGWIDVKGFNNDEASAIINEAKKLQLLVLPKPSDLLEAGSEQKTSLENQDHKGKKHE